MHSELIARLEAATGPSRELDKAILLALGYSWRGMAYWFRDDSHAWEGNTHFTASIDAALTLVPDGMRRRTVVYEDGRAGVQLWWPTEPLPDVWGKAYASEPIATVIAALAETQP